jgi:hypothetical protein
MAGLVPAIHVFPCRDQQSRGWQAFARHDGAAAAGAVSSNGGRYDATSGRTLLPQHIENHYPPMIACTPTTKIAHTPTAI